ncbi:LuxR C-terminal-related transcriptional regulator [Streptomyces sp. NPDC085937]|uniref:LuxR C-terminal-related transcriptional regulator n=1 Tax=Streptomyces sp. NPDC085937 TaxID=3365742 RepID=UPI0037D0ED40
MTGHTTARQQQVAELLDALHTYGGVRVVTGEPGCGRTTFLETAARLFHDGPVRHLGADRVGELDDALRTAAADGPPLVCVDDAHLWDAPSRAALGHAAALVRESGPPALLLLTVAGHRPVDREFTGLPVLRLGPLTPGDAALLVEEAADGAVDPAVREELVTAAEGNPALLRAAVQRLSPAQLTGARALPRPLVDAEVLAGVAGGRLPGPPGECGDLSLTTAAAVRATGEEDADAGLVLRACGAPAEGPLPEVLARTEGRLRFRSALVGRAVYACAPPERRRAAHRALAGAAAEAEGGGILALLHRSWAVPGPVSGLADALAAAAADPVCPATPALRQRALARAADLVPDDADRARRNLAAAEQALLAGHARDARRLLDLARGPGAPVSVRGGAELLRGAVLLADGPVDDARESFLLAAGLLAATAPRAAARATLGAADAAWSAGDPAACLSALAPTYAPPVTPLATACVRVPRTDTPEISAVPAGTLAWGVGGPAAKAARRCGQPSRRAARVGATAPRAADAPPTAPAPPTGPVPDAGTPPGADVARDHRDGMRAVLLGRFDLAAHPLLRVLERGLHGTDPAPLLRSAAAALMLGEVTAARRAGARALAAARTSGSAALEPRALEYLAYAELRAGRHQLARAHAEEGLRTAERAGQRNTAAHHHAVLALAASIEGEADLVGEHAEAALRTARRHGLAQAATLAHWAAARADLGAGRPREAAARLGPLVRPGARRGHFAVWMLAVPCFVEAAASAGRPQYATAVVEDFALWAACGADPQAPAQLLRCRALLAAPDAADALYLRALDRHDDDAGDFERARTELLYGKWLRRRRRLREARTRLEEARIGFERCGAGLWAQQAAAELRAGGAAPAAATGAGELARLTPQQLRIARCVAEGATNREVAFRLSVSTRTVDYHLRNVFATLGLRSRVELVRLVEQEEKTGARL